MGYVPDEQSELWTFMLEFYALPGVAPACLRLQDTYEADIPIFLAVLRFNALGGKLDAEQIRTIDRECRKWRDTVIKPLRSIRKAMKVDWNQTIAARAMKLRDDVKATELRAEQIEVHMLDQFLNEFSLSGGGDTTRNLHEVAGLMLHGQGLSDALPDDAIFIIDSIMGFPGLARQ